ncbi:uncharacterized protein PG986_012624 [Apiospora aurea]|uniref:Uncharacterized protein n=1 Tax=Apiospora aurea TaxID=335848 RepID=A0ABR1Q0I0_9PEZI
MEVHDPDPNRDAPVDVSVTRNVLGPLTTVFTPNPTCVTPIAGYCQSPSCVAWQGQVCSALAKWNNSYGVMDQSSCGGAAPPGTVAGTWYATSTTYHNIYAPLIQINWRAEDRPATSPNTAAATATTPRPTNPAAPTTSSPSDNPAPSGLSSGAYAGIGIGAALGGLMLLGGAVGGWMLLRRRRKAQDGSGGGGEPKGPTTDQDACQQQQPQEQRPASNIYEVSESGHTRETHELFMPTPDGGSTLMERQQRMEY